LPDPLADLDKDGQTSLLEALLMASRRVAEFYETEGRLANRTSACWMTTATDSAHRRIVSRDTRP